VILFDFALLNIFRFSSSLSVYIWVWVWGTIGFEPLRSCCT